jgi:hypothetical protein
MTRAVLALALLVAITAALQIAGAFWTEAPGVGCSFCHD